MTNKAPGTIDIPSKGPPADSRKKDGETGQGRKRVEEKENMRRNLKVLGLALVAVSAMSAVIASAAQATEAEFMAAMKAAEYAADRRRAHPGVHHRSRHRRMRLELVSPRFGVSEGNQPTVETEGEVEYTECEAFGLQAVSQLQRL